MEIGKYSKKTWIATLVLGIFSIVVDVLIMTGVIGSSETVESTTILTMAIGVLAVYYGIRGILYHKKREEQGE